MHQVTKLVKQLLSQPAAGPKVISYNLAATAPDAFDAMNRIADIALSDTGKMPEKPKKKDPLKPLPSLGSPLALR